RHPQADLPDRSARARRSRGALAARARVRVAGDPQDLPRGRVRHLRAQARLLVRVREPVRHDDLRAAARLSVGGAVADRGAPLRREPAQGRAAIRLVAPSTDTEAAELCRRGRALPAAARRAAVARAQGGEAAPLGGRGIRSAVQAALAGPRVRRARLPADQRRAQARSEGALGAARAERAQELALDPGVLCPNSSLEAIAWRAPNTASDLEGLPELKGWFLREFGAEVVAVAQEATNAAARENPR